MVTLMSVLSEKKITAFNRKIVNRTILADQRDKHIYNMVVRSFPHVT